jgi:hypothetical protein
VELLQLLNKFLLVFAFVVAPPVIDAKPGYAARGVVLEEGNGSLLLTTTPCAGDAYKREVRFRAPYDKTPAGPISCGARVYQQSIVRQR